MIRSIVIGILSVGALAACSTTPSHPVSRTAAAISPAATCSRIQGAAAASCTSPTRSYSQTQLRQTGKVDAAHALQMLDPSVSVHP